MIDNSEHEELLEILEEMEDQALAVQLLKQLNDLSSMLGKKVMDTSEQLDHEQWKIECDNMKSQLDAVIIEIKGHKK